MTDAITDPYPELHRLMNEYGEEHDTAKAADVRMKELKQEAAPLVVQLGGKADVGRFALHWIESTERSSYDTAAVDAVYNALKELSTSLFDAAHTSSTDGQIAHIYSQLCAMEAVLYEARKTSQVSASLRITPKKGTAN